MHSIRAFFYPCQLNLIGAGVERIAPPSSAAVGGARLEVAKYVRVMTDGRDHLGTYTSLSHVAQPSVHSRAKSFTLGTSGNWGVRQSYPGRDEGLPGGTNAE